MKALAQARLAYVKRAYEDPDNKILLKLELNGESLWFELMQILPEAGDEGEEILVQDLNSGEMGEYAWNQVTDWLIYTSERRISADDVYLLELK